jgi:nitroimidazol reductase NimA-like FMN-containing flavoprotein (pyridoxamine 5'-phosphate oxidase superfamily)
MTDPANALRQLLDSQRFGVLATESDGQPHASLMAFAATADLRDIAMVTERDTSKYRHVLANSRTALLVDNRSNEETDTQTGTAVTVVGQTTEAVGSERTALLDLYVAKHPSLADFASASGSTVLRLRVDVYRIVTRFQQVVLHYPG